MTKTRFLRILCLVLALTSALTLFIIGGDLLPEPADARPVLYINSIFSGDYEPSAWTNDTLDQETLKSLFNGHTLYPQITGYVELDALLEEIFSGAGENADLYTKFRYFYDYLVKNVTYSWEGYGYTYASVASYKSFRMDYLQDLTYTEGLQKSIPDDMANRAYHILSAKKGVCYDYAIALAVGARYLGLESYVRTGYFALEEYHWGTAHHGWAVVMLDGKEFVFDAQRDARNYEYYLRNGYYFGLPQENTYRYYPNYSTEDIRSNQALAEQMLPVTAEREYRVEIAVTTQGSGTVTGGGTYLTGQTALLTARGSQGHGFLGWYEGETLISQEETLELPVSGPLTLTAWFEICPSRDFSDLKIGAWYHRDVDQVITRGIMGGTSQTQPLFRPEAQVTRATVAAILYRLSDQSFEAGESPFTDVAPGDWFYECVLWAYNTGVVEGDGNGQFLPNEPVTREQLLLMFHRYDSYMEANHVPAQDEETPDHMPDLDQVSPWAMDSLRWGYGLGLIRGRTSPQLCLDPQGTTQRCELAAVICRYLNLP